MNGAFSIAIGPDVAYAFESVPRSSAVSACRLHIGRTGDLCHRRCRLGYTAMEIETLSKYRMPAIATVYNNNAWGMDRNGEAR